MAKRATTTVEAYLRGCGRADRRRQRDRGFLGSGSGRSFVCSDYLRLEVLPNAVFFERSGIVAFYEEFFDSVERWVRPSPELSRQALALACRYGLGAMDALHVAAADSEGAELITAEISTKPMLRVVSPQVTSIRTGNGGSGS